MENDSVLISELLSLEESLLKPNVRKSHEVLSQLLTDDFIEIGSSGKLYRKNDVIASLSAETSNKITLIDFRVKLLSTDVALVTYKAVKTGAQPSESQYSLRSSLWKATDGKWKIVFHQGTVTDNFKK